MNGWIRLAIVLTFVWAIVVFFYVRHVDMDRRSDWFRLAYSTCSESKAAPKDATRDCLAHASESASVMDPGPGNAAFAALAPIPFIWLTGWLVFLVIRWVVRGFKGAT